MRLLANDDSSLMAMTGRPWFCDYGSPISLKGTTPRCVLEVIRSDGTQRMEIPGVDTLDCIIAALAMAGSTIRGLNESIFGGELRGEAWPAGGPALGLPTIEDSWRPK